MQSIQWNKRYIIAEQIQEAGTIFFVVNILLISDKATKWRLMIGLTEKKRRELRINTES